jgi:hypothetical protein
MHQVSTDAIVFHFRKHHLKELKSHAAKCSEEEFHQHLLSLGLSMFDVYLGNLSSKVIREEISAQLKSKCILHKSEYSEWIKTQGGYSSVNVSDSSTWTLRYLEQTTFIHVHPGRYSIHTIRIKSQHLKQALWLFRHQLTLSDSTILECRKTLGMSPTGTLNLSGLEKIHQLISSH